MLWFMVILAVFLLGIFILPSWISFNVHLHKSNKNDLLELRIKAIYGLLRFHYKVPVIQLDSQGVNIKTEKKDTLHPQQRKQKKKLTLQLAYRSFLQTRDLIHHVKGFQQWLGRMLGHVRCTRFEWSTRIGLGDASHTAIISGALLGLKWTFTGIADRFIQLRTTPRFLVRPEYQHSILETELQCIVKIRFGYAIVAGVQFLIRVVKVKGGIRTWKNTLFKA